MFKINAADTNMDFEGKIHITINNNKPSYSNSYGKYYDVAILINGSKYYKFLVTNSTAKFCYNEKAGLMIRYPEDTNPALCSFMRDFDRALDAECEIKSMPILDRKKYVESSVVEDVEYCATSFVNFLKSNTLCVDPIILLDRETNTKGYLLTDSPLKLGSFVNMMETEEKNKKRKTFPIRDFFREVYGFEGTNSENIMEFNALAKDMFMPIKATEDIFKAHLSSIKITTATISFDSYFMGADGRKSVTVRASKLICEPGTDLKKEADEAYDDIICNTIGKPDNEKSPSGQLLLQNKKNSSDDDLDIDLE